MLNFIKHQQTTLIRVPTLFMYDIIKNVDSYSQFLPGCSKSRTFNHQHNYFEGELEIDYKLFKSSYISKVTLEPKDYKITSLSENNSVFKQLKSIWHLQGNDQQCQANYSIEFKFNNPLFQHASQLFLNEIVKSTSHAFEQRAYQLIKNSEFDVNKKNDIKTQTTDIFQRLLQKNLITQLQLNKINNNKEIIQMTQQLLNLYSDAAQAEQKCAEFIQEYLLQQNI